MNNLWNRSVGPFDEAAVQRHRHMGLLDCNGDVNADAVNFLAHLCAGLFFDALCDSYVEMQTVSRICQAFCKSENVEAQRVVLMICSEYDTVVGLLVAMAEKTPDHFISRGGQNVNLKDLIFGGGVKSGGDGGTYRDSIQAWLPIKNIIGGVVITKDGRFVKILELLPVNIYLKSPNDRQNIISSFAAYLKIAPNDLQMVARTLPADTQAYVEQMQRYAEKEDNEACREMIEDNIQEIGNGIASDAMRHRFFLVFQYEAGMRAKRNTVDSIIQRLNEEADTARRYLDVCELEVLEPQYSDNFVLKLLYEILSKKTSQRVRLPDGVFDMTTAVHGIYEE